MQQDQDRFRSELLKCLRSLKAFALSLCRNPILAEDLVQETALRALNFQDQFEVGTNMPAWLTTILRNFYFTKERQRQRREVEDPDGLLEATLRAEAGQEEVVYFAEVQKAIGQLSVEQRKALLLAGMAGYSTDEASQLLDCAPGTIKSRVNRARITLSRILAAPKPPVECEPTPVKVYRLGWTAKKPAVYTPALLTHSVAAQKDKPAILSVAPLFEPQPTARLATHDVCHFFDTAFVLESTLLLPNGEKQHIYRAA